MRWLPSSGCTACRRDDFGSRCRSRHRKSSSVRTGGRPSRSFRSPRRAGSADCTTAPTTTARPWSIAAPYQSMEHPAADLAKGIMQLAVAGTGIRLSDGSTNILPIGDRTDEAWALHARLVRRSLERGFYQGWDLHAHQLPTRFIATYAFFRDGYGAAAARLKAYLGAKARSRARRARDRARARRLRAEGGAVRCRVPGGGRPRHRHR